MSETTKDYLAWAIVILVGGVTSLFLLWATGGFILVPIGIILIIWAVVWSLVRIFDDYE